MAGQSVQAKTSDSPPPVKRGRTFTEKVIGTGEILGDILTRPLRAYISLMNSDASRGGAITETDIGNMLEATGYATVGGMLGARPQNAVGMGMTRLATPDEPPLVYHSSPHRFDQFEWSPRTRGGGEGAQVVTDGLYLAESPAVSGKFGHYYNKFLPEMNRTTEGYVADLLKHYNAPNDFQSAIELLNMRIARSPSFDERFPNLREVNASALARDQRTLEWLTKERLRGGQPVRETLEPYTYEVRINTPQQSLLNWDEALRYQPKEMQDAMQSIVKETGAGVWPDGVNVYDRMPVGDFTGAEVARSIQKMVGKPRAADMMLDRGIPGVRFLDGTSRERGMLAEFPDAEGNMIALGMPSRGHIVDALERRYGFTREQADAVPVVRNPRATDNYAIRDADKLQILKRYAIPGMLGAGGMLQATDPGRETQ